LTQHLPRQSRSVINSARAMEFDYVPFEQLKQLAACLRRHASQDSFEAPPEDDHDWWEDAAVEAGLSAGMGAELAESVHSDFASREFHLVNRAPMSVWLGDLCSTESRLAIQALNIKGICTIASHGIDELWKDDGVAYHTAIVSNSAPIALHLDACVEFIRSHTPAIICCSSGFGVSAMVTAAFFMSSAPALDVQAAVRMLEEQAAGVGKLDLSEEDLADLEAFRAARQPEELQTPLVNTAARKRAVGRAQSACPLKPSCSGQGESRNARRKIMITS